MRANVLEPTGLGRQGVVTNRRANCCGPGDQDPKLPTATRFLDVPNAQPQPTLRSALFRPKLVLLYSRRYD